MLRVCDLNSTNFASPSFALWSEKKDIGFQNTVLMVQRTVNCSHAACSICLSSWRKESILMKSSQGKLFIKLSIMYHDLPYCLMYVFYASISVW